MRLFFAVKLSDEVNSRIAEAVGRMRSTAAESARIRVSWVREENLHVTLKFLGETAEAGLPEVREAGRLAARAASIGEVVARGVGSFPNETHARVLWVGLQDSGGIIPRLAHDLEEHLEKKGFKRDPHGYTPHITVGRVKEGKGAGEIMFPFKRAAFGACAVTELLLMESVLEPGGSRYAVVDRFPLSGALSDGSGAPEASSKGGSGRS